MTQIGIREGHSFSIHNLLDEGAGVITVDVYGRAVGMILEPGSVPDVLATDSLLRRRSDLSERIVEATRCYGAEMFSPSYSEHNTAEARHRVVGQALFQD